jgi:large subunit ribosomal protein L22
MRISPSKARDLARSIQGKPVPVALQLVEFSERKAARMIGKTLESAIANAENNYEQSADALTVRTAVVNDGPRLKRHWPRSRGMARPILRRMCHITVTLTDGK